MKRNKKVALTATALSLSAILAACGADEEKSTTSTADGEKELNLLITSEPPSLHPQLASDTTSGAILENTFEGLTTMKNGEPVLGAAEDYIVSDDLFAIFSCKATASRKAAAASDFCDRVWEKASNACRLCSNA